MSAFQLPTVTAASEFRRVTFTAPLCARREIRMPWWHRLLDWFCGCGAEHWEVVPAGPTAFHHALGSIEVQPGETITFVWAPIPGTDPPALGWIPEEQAR